MSISHQLAQQRESLSQKQKTKNKNHILPGSRTPIMRIAAESKILKDPAECGQASIDASLKYNPRREGRNYPQRLLRQTSI